jgi:hypothetical protein
MSHGGGISMKRHVIVALFAAVAVFALFAGLVYAEYDKDLVVGVMRASGSLLGELNKAVGEGNYYTAAEKFMAIAKNIKSIEDVTPVKGNKADWDSIHNDLIKAAFRGIGACGDGNKEKVTAAVGEIGALIKKGHTLFR